MSSLVADLDGQARRKGSKREVRKYAPHASQGGSGQIAVFFSILQNRCERMKSKKLKKLLQISFSLRCISFSLCTIRFVKNILLLFRFGRSTQYLRLKSQRIKIHRLG
jgi:hypothetical protein